jgi:apolipoprotein N-acyltransferase
MVPGTDRRPTIAAWRDNTGAITLTCFLCLALVALAYRGRQGRWGLALVFTAFALVFASAGCGGGGGGGGGNGLTNPGTPTGSKVITVTITVNSVMQTVPNLTVNVQ